MSEHDRGDDKPTTSSEAAGSVVGRLSGNSGTSSARQIEGEVVRSMAEDSAVPAPAARVRRKVGRRQEGERTGKLAEQHEAMLRQESKHPDQESHIISSDDLGEGLTPEEMNEREDRFSEFQVSALFIASILATLGFIVAYVLVPPHAALGQYMNYALGGTLTIMMLGVGAGMILWAKKLMPHDKAIQERHPFHSPEEDEIEAEDIFFAGVDASGIAKRGMLRRTLIGAMAVLPLPAVLLLRDMGPLPHNRLRVTGWKKGSRLVDLDTHLPVKLGDIEIGGIQTVMPEGFDSADNYALAPSILIRFAPGEILSTKESNWGVSDHVVYSKICSHAGCPISLYEQQTHHLLCPCHQSTFDMARDAKVIFGPAARPLPQLKIYVDDEGYFRAAGEYSQPVGPSFWERRNA